jgi:RNA polymerase sigma-70 factor (ECF subfamily)
MDAVTESVVQEIKMGNVKRFEKIFKEFYGLLCYEARGYMKTNYLVDEIVCDVFTRLWLNREKLEIQSSLRDYLIKSVHNKCIDYFRHQKVQEKAEKQLDMDKKHQSTLLDLGEDPEDYLVTEELENKINKAIDSLPEQYKRTFKLSRFGELTYEQVAAEMNISVNSVKTNMKKALAILRNELKGYAPF